MQCCCATSRPSRRCSFFWPRRFCRCFVNPALEQNKGCCFFLCDHLYLQSHCCSIVSQVGSIWFMLLSALALLERVWSADCSEALKVDNGETSQWRNIQTCCGFSGLVQDVLGSSHHLHLCGIQSLGRYLERQVAVCNHHCHTRESSGEQMGVPVPRSGCSQDGDELCLNPATTYSCWPWTLCLSYSWPLYLTALLPLCSSFTCGLFWTAAIAPLLVFH